MRPAAGTPPAKAVEDESLLERQPSRRSYLKMAFGNPYNLTMLVGGLSAAALTFNPVLAVLTLGLEGLWMLHAPDSQLLQRLLWDRQFERMRSARATAERAAQMQSLDTVARARVEGLITRQEQINYLAAQNPSFAGDLLRTELGKTDRLVQAFLDMTLTCERYEAYLDNVDIEQLNRDRKRYALIVKAGPANDPEAQIAQKNMAVTDKRVVKLEEIKRYLQVARGQLDLIENSFQLLVEQIVTMQSPRELSGQLDELLDGVESIRETARDTEQLIGTLEHDV
jgi:hypothetical protein